MCCPFWYCRSQDRFANERCKKRTHKSTRVGQLHAAMHDSTCEKNGKAENKNSIQFNSVVATAQQSNYNNCDYIFHCVLRQLLAFLGELCFTIFRISAYFLRFFLFSWPTPSQPFKLIAFTFFIGRRAHKFSYILIHDWRPSGQR